MALPARGRQVNGEWTHGVPARELPAVTARLYSRSSDLVLQMIDYACLDVTERAKQLASGVRASRSARPPAVQRRPRRSAPGPSFGPPVTSRRRPQHAGFLAEP